MSEWEFPVGVASVLIGAIVAFGPEVIGLSSNSGLILSGLFLIGVGVVLIVKSAK
ncbi:MAG: hypothetical protein J4472_00390 [DPANN group archaeon]|nr:hypothetical protein [DPANN group archaeon]